MEKNKLITSVTTSDWPTQNTNLTRKLLRRRNHRTTATPWHSTPDSQGVARQEFVDLRVLTTICWKSSTPWQFRADPLCACEMTRGFLTCPPNFDILRPSVEHWWLDRPSRLFGADLLCLSRRLGSLMSLLNKNFEGDPFESYALHYRSLINMH